ncbi:MAG: histidine kinase [Bacteroidota bacterium]
MKLSFINNKRITIFLHIIIWVLLLIIPLFIFGYNSEIDDHILVITYFQVVSYAIIFYLHFFLLIPKLFFNNRKIWYFVVSLALIMLLGFVTDIGSHTQGERFREHHFSEERTPHHLESRDSHSSKNIPIYNFFLTSFLVTGFSLGLRFSYKLSKNEKLRKETENEKINSELVFLKSQMNPHFFFNTLNNIYALVSSKSDDAPIAVLKLSKLMRYMLYETQKGNTLLGQEIEFMKNYFDLMKLRLSNKVIVNIHFPDSYAYMSIPPLLFIPFIENAFKHGVSYKEPSSINISLKVEQNTIHFICVNSVFKKEEEKEASMGIGLENIKKRLALLYPDKHSLVIDKTDNLFSVKLIIHTV